MVTAPRGNLARYVGWVVFVVVVVVILVNFVSFVGLDGTLNCQTSYNRDMAQTLATLHKLNDQAGEQQAAFEAVLRKYSSTSPQVKSAREVYARQKHANLMAREAHPLPAYHC